MLTLRQRIFVISGLVMAVIIAIVLAILFLRKDQPVNVEPVDEGQQRRPSQVLEDGTVIPAGEPFIQSEDNTPPEEIYAKQVARIFVERFATFSNQNNNRHIKDIESMVTANMKAWLNSQFQDQDMDYEGVTTNVMSTKIISIDETSAVIEIRAKRAMMSQRSSDSAQTEVKDIQKKGTVNLVRVGNDWKVDGFYWDE